MYGKYVSIIVDGFKVEIFVPCTPDTLESKLKERAINIYTRELEERLLVQNGLK